MPMSSKPESWHPFTAQERIILFCAATGIDHAAAGIIGHSMQMMETRGLIEREDDGGYRLTDVGRRAFVGLLGRAGIDARMREDKP